MSKINAKTIQIYLPFGNPRGIRIADITSRTVQAVYIPRANIEEASQRKELRNVGVYFLIGENESSTKPLFYVGEAEDCLSRLKQHNKDDKKDFFTAAIVVTSKTQYFTKAHVKYLEWYCYKQAKEAGRYELVNGSIPTKSYVSEPVEADLLDNFDTINILVSTLGFPLFESIRARKEKAELFYCKGKDTDAVGEYTEDGFVVFKGSKSNLDETKSFAPYNKLRQQLINNDFLIEKGGVYVLFQDHIFKSPSAASDALLGRSSNGWLEWKTKGGKTLDEVKRK